MLKSIVCSVVGCCIMMSGSTAVSANDAVDLKVGDAAPVFEVEDDKGETWKSKDHVGKKIVVVYFYPADMTGGCTKQACAFRDDFPKLEDEGIEVVGVSGDSAANHRLFKKAHDLNFALLADVEGKVADAFGVPVTREEKSVKATIDGVVRAPSEFSMTRAALPSMMATQELVVPRSIPMTLAMCISLSIRRSASRGPRCLRHPRLGYGCPGGRPRGRTCRI